MADESLEVKIARLEEKLLSSKDALRLAEALAGKALEKTDKSHEIQWSHIFSVIAILISLLVLMAEVFKKI